MMTGAKKCTKDKTKQKKQKKNKKYLKKVLTYWKTFDIINIEIKKEQNKIQSRERKTK